MYFVFHIKYNFYPFSVVTLSTRLFFNKPVMNGSLRLLDKTPKFLPQGRQTRKSYLLKAFILNLFIDISLLKKNRHYALLYVGQFVSFIGTMITTVALPYQVYQLTHSSLMVGLLSLVQLIPLLITALLGGVFADKYNRRSLVIMSEACLVIGCALLAINAYIAQPSLAGIFVISSLMSAITGLHRPALESMSLQLVLAGDY